VFAVQLAKLAGAAVIGTASAGTAEFLRQLGAEPVAYGTGLADRVRALASGGVTAATDLFGTETAETALALGVPPERICTIAAGPSPPGGVRATGGIDAGPDALEQITGAILAGKITVPIAATFPVGADPRRRHTAGRAARPRQDRDHAVTAERGQVSGASNARYTGTAPKDPARSRPRRTATLAVGWHFGHYPLNASSDEPAIRQFRRNSALKLQPGSSEGLWNGRGVRNAVSLPG